MLEERRRHHLKAMGITPWRERGGAAEAEPAEPAEEPQAEAPGDVPESIVELETTHTSQQPPLDESPIVEPAETTATEPDQVPSVEAEKPQATDIATLDWPALRERVSECSLCPELVANRSQTVFGVGNTQADWLIIGEAPGADEDAQGEPFVGRAGQLLNLMLQAVGKRREEVYIANVLKCRPPNNRDPHVDEAAHCQPYLRRQIELIQPKLILLVGRIAAHHLLQVETPIGKLRGQVHELEGIPVVVTYHPAYLLRSPGEKRKSWEDLKLAMRIVQEDGE